MRPAFSKDGTITAANSSSISDGAAALVLTTEEYAQSHGLNTLAKLWQLRLTLSIQANLLLLQLVQFRKYLSVLVGLLMK